MNKDRRKAIQDIQKRLSDIQSEFEAIRDELDTIKDEERDYFDNMPESLQQGDRGQQADAAATALEEAHTLMDDFSFDDLDGHLNTAAE